MAAEKTTEVFACRPMEQINDIVRKAVAAKGRVYGAPQNRGFVHGHSLEDLGDHRWRYIFMDPDYIPA